MNSEEMNRLTKHFDTYFEQEDGVVLHPMLLNPHIDCLLYPPTEKYPYWKLATMGASDYRMPGKAPLGNRNEYFIMIDKDVDMNEPDNQKWFYEKLYTIAAFAFFNKTLITYGHSIEWAPGDEEEMVSALLVLPEIIPNPECLKCKLGIAKTATILQAVFLNRNETKRLLNIGPYEFEKYIYNDDPNSGERSHFISERKRSDKF